MEMGKLKQRPKVFQEGRRIHFYVFSPVVYHVLEISGDITARKLQILKDCVFFPTF